MSETSEENKDRWAIHLLSTHSFLSILAIQVICIPIHVAINRPVEVVV